MCEPSNEFPHEEVRQSLRKSERLHLKNEIDLLFSQGKWFSVHEFSIIYRITDGPEPALLISVPKKHQHDAWQRNKSKRVIREIYRKHKHILSEALKTHQCGIHFAIVCKSREPLEYHQTESKIILTLQRLTKVISLEKSL